VDAGRNNSSSAASTTQDRPHPYRCLECGFWGAVWTRSCACRTTGCRDDLASSGARYRSGPSDLDKTEPEEHLALHRLAGPPSWIRCLQCPTTASMAGVIAGLTLSGASVAGRVAPACALPSSCRAGDSRFSAIRALALRFSTDASLLRDGGIALTKSSELCAIRRRRFAAT